MDNSGLVHPTQLITRTYVKEHTQVLPLLLILCTIVASFHYTAHVDIITITSEEITSNKVSQPNGSGRKLLAMAAAARRPLKYFRKPMTVAKQAYAGVGKAATRVITLARDEALKKKIKSQEGLEALKGTVWSFIPNYRSWQSFGALMRESKNSERRNVMFMKIGSKLMWTIGWSAIMASLVACPGLPLAVLLAVIAIKILTSAYFNAWVDKPHGRGGASSMRKGMTHEMNPMQTNMMADAAGVVDAFREAKGGGASADMQEDSVKGCKPSETLKRIFGPIMFGEENYGILCSSPSTWVEAIAGLVPLLEIIDGIKTIMMEVRAATRDVRASSEALDELKTELGAMGIRSGSDAMPTLADTQARLPMEVWEVAATDHVPADPQQVFQPFDQVTDEESALVHKELRLSVVPPQEWDPDQFADPGRGGDDDEAPPPVHKNGPVKGSGAGPNPNGARPPVMDVPMDDDDGPQPVYVNRPVKGSSESYLSAKVFVEQNPNQENTLKISRKYNGAVKETMIRSAIAPGASVMDLSAFSYYQIFLVMLMVTIVVSLTIYVARYIYKRYQRKSMSEYKPLVDTMI